MDSDRDNKGKFTQGNKGKPKGALNKSSEKIRLAYAQLLEDNLETLIEDVQSLEPKERARFMLDLSKYIIPTLKATEMTLGSDSDKIPVITFTSADK